MSIPVSEKNKLQAMGPTVKGQMKSWGLETVSTKPIPCEFSCPPHSARIDNPGVFFPFGSQMLYFLLQRNIVSFYSTGFTGEDFSSGRKNIKSHHDSRRKLTLTDGGKALMFTIHMKKQYMGENKECALILFKKTSQTYNT